MKAAIVVDGFVELNVNGGTFDGLDIGIHSTDSDIDLRDCAFESTRVAVKGKGGTLAAENATHTEPPNYRISKIATAVWRASHGHV